MNKQLVSIVYFPNSTSTKKKVRDWVDLLLEILELFLGRSSLTHVTLDMFDICGEIKYSNKEPWFEMWLMVVDQSLNKEDQHLYDIKLQTRLFVAKLLSLRQFTIVFRDRRTDMNFVSDFECP